MLVFFYRSLMTNIIEIISDLAESYSTAKDHKDSR